MYCPGVPAPPFLSLIFIDNPGFCITLVENFILTSCGIEIPFGLAGIGFQFFREKLEGMFGSVDSYAF